MIDVHAHILPGLDDGAESMEDTLELAELAVESHVDTIVATPHCNQVGRFENYWSEALREQVERVQAELRRQRIPLTLLPGMEIFASGDMGQKMSDGRLIGLNHTRYYLVEFPFDESPDQIGECLEEILTGGKIALIAHPERYFCVQEYPFLVYQWIQMGCRIQVNKGSILGRFGRYVARTADVLLRHELVTCVASDAHSPYMRTTFLEDAADYLAHRFGEGCVYELLEENPARMIQGAPIHMHARPPERKRRFFL
ncbi:MAG: tyrosine-protein phosphatase [Butyricicoccus sp.]